MLVTDVELTARARRGDLDAFGALVGRWLPSVYDLAARLLPEQEEADEITREAFGDALEQLRTTDEPLVFGLTVMGAVYDRANEQLATRVRRPVRDELGASLEPWVDRRVWHAVLALDIPARVALHLHTRHRFAPDDVAALLGVMRGRADAFLAGVVDDFIILTGPAVGDSLAAYARLGAIEVPAGLPAMIWRDLQQRWAILDEAKTRSRSGPPRWRNWVAAALFLVGFIGFGVVSAFDSGPTETPLAAASPTPTAVPSPSPEVTSEPPGGRATFDPSMSSIPIGSSPTPSAEPSAAPTGGTAPTETATETQPAVTPQPSSQPTELTVRILEPEHGTVTTAEQRANGDWAAEVQALAEAYDPEGQRLEAQWWSDRQEHPLGRTGRPIFWLELPDGCPGDALVHTVLIEVTDPDGNTATDAIDIEVRCP